MGKHIAEKALRQAQADLHSKMERECLLAEIILQGVVRQDADGAIISMNPAAKRILGKTPGNFHPGSSLMEEYGTIREDGSAFPCREHPTMAALRTGKPVRHVTMGIFNPHLQAYRWIQIDAIPVIRDEDSRPSEVYAVFEDITERRHMEQALRESQRRERERAAELQTVFDTAPVGLSLALRGDGTHIEGNLTLENMFGLSPGAEMSKIGPRAAPFTVFQHGRELKHSSLPMQRALRGEIVAGQEMDVICEDGKRIAVVASARPLFDEANRPRGAVGAFLDLSERKRNEEALRNATQRFQMIVNNAPVAIYVKDRQGRFVFANTEIERFTGYSQERILGMTDYDFAPKEDADRWRKNDLKMLQGGRANFEETGTDRNGRSYINTSVKFPLNDASGAAVEVCGISLDITERKRMEKQLRNSQEALERSVRDRTAKLHRANRALRVLTECNEALVRETDETKLLVTICQVIVKTGWAKMAWVGFPENDKKKTVRPAASAGDEGGYLSQVSITWADEQHGRGPAGAAIRMGRMKVCHSVDTASYLLPWREALARHGFRAMISLPLTMNRRRPGALTIYASTADSFNPEEIELLRQLANNLAFGIAALRTAAERVELQRELLTISEREKQVFSQELHDGLCQNLAGISMMCHMLARRLSERGDRDSEAAQQISAFLNLSVNEARNLSHGLHPVGPEGDGLMNALAELAGIFTNLFQIPCTFHCPKPVILADAKASTHLFRIAQEAINNSRKHGEASKVRISLTESSRGIVLGIQDNGIGIPPDLQKAGGWVSKA